MRKTMVRTHNGITISLIVLFGIVFSGTGTLGFVNALAAESTPKAQREDTPTRRLLDTLKQQNEGQELFKDSWCRTLKEIVDLGSEAVPELIEELDATQEDKMLRCLGFTLRAIGDKRALPALIRAIPKTLRPAGSDMGLRTDDPELLKFAQTFDLDPGNRTNTYSFGRPVREVCGALQKLTGKEHGENEMFSVFLEGSPSKQQRQREFFHRIAEKWAEWWEQNWADYVQDEKYSMVHLTPQEEKALSEAPLPETHFKTDGARSNWILESVLNPKSMRVFYDFDVGRVAALPDKWRKADDIESHLEEILFWATREGFDLMGTEYQSPEGPKIFVLRSIGLRAWELGPARWKMDTADITLEALQAEGRPAEKLLLHYDDTTKSIAPREPASFLYITRHGTPGLLFVGVEVQDDTQKPGGRQQGDNELIPVAFHKGRRFGFKGLEEINR